MSMILPPIWESSTLSSDVTSHIWGLDLTMMTCRLRWVRGGTWASGAVYGRLTNFAERTWQ